MARPRLRLTLNGSRRMPLTPRLQNVLRPLRRGYFVPDDPSAFVTEEELFGEKRHRRRSRPRPVADYLTGLSQLSAGDFVVHGDHGIAKYQGLRHLSVAGMEGDYLHLEYASGDR